MRENTIASDESEGLFNEFIQEQLDEIVEHIVNEGDLDRLGDAGSDVIVEMDDITPPTFVYGDDSGGGNGEGGQGPGDEKGKLRFRLPFQTLMEMIGNKLQLPDLVKEGAGKIKEVSYAFRTFGQVGVILDKRRTFKRALRSSIGIGSYNPDKEKFDVEVRRRDRRYKVPQRIEKPLYKAVVFFMGDISYSTSGERLELEKRLVNFIHQWLDFNYGVGNVEHRFFVHDMEAYEVEPEEFYKVSNTGGTRASIVFELVHQTAFNEYDVGSTNFYAFYFGDGEVFGDDPKKIVKCLESQMRPMFNRIGVVETQPSDMSQLVKAINKEFEDDQVIRVGQIRNKRETVEIIKALFGDNRA